MPVTPGASPTEVNLNATVPAAPAGETNVEWQAGSPYPDPNFPEKFVRDTSAYMPNLVGDSGSGGTSGAAPAPAAGDAAAGKFLKADGAWEVAATPAQIQDESFIYAADTGTANAYAVTLSPAPTLVAGSLVVVKIANANTGASTLAVNGGAATAIVKESGGSLVALTGAELNAGQIAFLVYDGTHWQLIGVSSGGGSGTVTTTGSPAGGNLAKFSGGTSITNGDLSGDVTTAGTLAATVVGLEGKALDAATVGSPSNGQVITYDSVSGKYKAVTPAAAGFTNGQIGITVDGAGSVPGTGSKAFFQVPYDCTIVSWTILGNVSGSAQITVKKSSYAGFPTTTSIVASAPPNLSSAQKNTSSTLTGWTTSLSKGDILEFNLDSITTISRVMLALAVTRSD